MDPKRLILYAALFFVVYSLWMAWEKDYPPPKVAQKKEEVQIAQNEQEGDSQKGNTFIPNIKTKTDTKNIHISANVKKSSSKDLVYVKTDVLKLAIDLRQGDIVQAGLIKYGQSLEEKNKPFTLLSDDSYKYVANSGLFTKGLKGAKNVIFNFSSINKKYILGANDQSIKVVLKAQTEEGLSVLKTFTFERGSYLVNVDYQLQNQGQSAWHGFMNNQLLREMPQGKSAGMFGVGSYTGASFSDPAEKLFQKLSFKNMVKANLNKEVTNGWVAMQQHYFLSAWVPKNNSTNHFYSRVVNGQYLIGFVSRPIFVPPGQSLSLDAKLYVGPEITSTLSKIAPGLDLTVDYGWLWFISKYLFILLAFINSLIGNWGWSIVIVTMLIKLAFYRLSAKSYTSMASMKKLQPKLNALKERFGDDKARLSQATMELYREEKVNPFGGCLPIMVQIPVFIALYWVLLESVQLRHAPWILWIHDLSSADPYYILPIVMGLSMFIQQKLAPASPDPAQAKMMMMLPIVFTVLFAHFPAGLVLYWTVNNTLSILQQWHITRMFEENHRHKGGTKKFALSK